MINVSRVINDPRISKTFVVFRKSGKWEKGRFIQEEVQTNMDGVIVPATPEEIEQIPEADRKGGEISIHTTSKLYTTHLEKDFKGTSDEVLWHGERYKLTSLGDLSDYGYYKAIGARKAGY
ncbi:hypothetical protein FC976_18470 [Clostridium sporogenes]|uniref:hypothetical protein n=1 Tax=Clostridium sporogenes TaxID=1509 RepID=UPI0013D7A97E|nr:hypothetical protein [Clostridium sporogenes]NFH34450.1 hypothetical protein [Clostridium sporogenes]NFH49135.1 hypothetical protein [Clostridium sporogenes]NFL21817.1 hypothetical protein [Clostridium sporogenes]NFN74084.1 hypothetical protein [Clostridium sporogenes]NFV23504.1 hypothetical protein [Clostridium sporogenes]